ncbi:DoxX family protein [Acidipropionibacterium jensenii]|uniref:DoxX family protein n=1 Tax=Acidipropionibacterium jensenii TaxID=1749 RepID=UPI00214B5A45|nr:DoxX family protein [Acidipropionibacterium jensenii]
MSFSKFIGRSLLSSMFVVGGVNEFRNAEKMTGMVDALKEQLPDAISGPLGTVDSETLVKLNGATMAAAASTLALGILPRLSAAVLAAQMVPVTVAGHPFWKKDGAERQGNWIHFLKNVSLTGGLLLVSATKK